MLHKQKVSRAGLLVVYYERVLCGHIEARYALGWRCFGNIYFPKMGEQRHNSLVETVLPLHSISLSINACIELCKDGEYAVTYSY